jgi:hypothetical protein
VPNAAKENKARKINKAKEYRELKQILQDIGESRAI